MSLLNTFRGAKIQNSKIKPIKFLLLLLTYESFNFQLVGTWLVYSWDRLN